MNKNELISVIIPTYDTNQSLDIAIDSVLRQTYKNIEIIVVDDNKNDSVGRKNAEKIMIKYQKNPKIKYIKHKYNKNGSAARNTGAREASGIYLAFLDDDDFFYKTKLEIQLNFLKNENLEFCSCFYRKNGRDILFPIKDDYIEEVFMLKLVPQTSSFFMTKKLFEQLNGFDETYIRHQDYEFLIRVCNITKIGVVDKILYERKNNFVNNIPNPDKMLNVKNKFLTDFVDIMNKKNINVSKVKGKNFSAVCIMYLKKGKVLDALRCSIHYCSIYYYYYLIIQLLLMFKNNFVKMFMRVME